MPSIRTPTLLAVVTLALYAVTTYGGIRSPDEEVVFLTAESLAHDGTFAVASGPAGWSDFGVARGVDGRLYSVFGPLESVLLVPAVWAADEVAEELGSDVPLSLYAGDGLARHMRGERTSEPRPHAVRFVASFLNVAIAAAGVVLVWFLVRRVSQSDVGSLLVALAYAVGSLAWAYAGTLFTEPLATTLAVASLLAAHGARRAHVALAGLLLGLAVSAHVTAILFLPFFLVFAALHSSTDRLPRAIAYALGFGLVVVVLGLYNLDRFGSVLETGRTVDAARAVKFGYGEWVAPWRGLHGLTVSAGKGLLVYCPIVVLGLVGWRALHRRSALLSLVLGGAAGTRLLIIASRSDWHGGFCVGPRLLLMLVPFLLVPIAFWVAERPRRAWFAAAAVAAAALEQSYLALSEPFRFFHWVRVNAMARGVDVFAGDQIYLDWSFSPLVHLIRGGTGSWVFSSTALRDVVLATATCVAVSVFGAVAALRHSWSADRPDVRSP